MNVWTLDNILLCIRLTIVGVLIITGFIPTACCIWVIFHSIFHSKELWSKDDKSEAVVMMATSLFAAIILLAIAYWTIIYFWRLDWSTGLEWLRVPVK